MELVPNLDPDPAIEWTSFPSGRYRSSLVRLNNLDADRKVAQKMAQQNRRNNLREDLKQTFESWRQKERHGDDSFKWVMNKFRYKVRTGPEEETADGQRKYLTEEVPTDAYGMIDFVQNSRTTTAEYIRVSPDTEPEDLYQLFTKTWQVKTPNIIISVTGGSENFKLAPDLCRLFKRGLMAAAKNTGAWIITGGTNNGVTSYVGDAVAEESDLVRNILTVIGFVPWGVIYGRDDLVCKAIGDHGPVSQSDNTSINEDDHPNECTDFSNPASEEIGDIEQEETDEKAPKEDVVIFDTRREYKRVEYPLKKQDKSKDVLLNPNHSHFVFVDDGSEGDFGAEIDLRIKFERCVSSKIGKPDTFCDQHSPEDQADSFCQECPQSSHVVCVLLEGGPDHLRTVKRCLDVGTPVVIVKGSGKAANIIAFAKENSTWGSDPTSTVFSEKIYVQLKRDMTETFKFKESERESKLNMHMEFLKEICCRKNNNKVTIYSIRDPENCDLDKAILGALLKAVQENSEESSQEELTKQLILAVRWNRADLAAKYVFGRNEQNDWPFGFLEDIFLECCLDNKHEFVKLFLNNVLRLEDLSFVDQIEELFSVLNTGSDLMFNFLNSIPNKEKHRERYLVGVAKGIQSLVGEGFKMPCLETSYDLKAFADIRQQGIPEEIAGEVSFMDVPEIEDPTVLLFTWAIIMNYHEIAQMFLVHGSDFMAKALTGMRLYRRMSESLDDGNKKEEMLQNARDFGRIALDLLKHCHENDETELQHLLVAQTALSKTHSVLGLADLAHHEEFIAHSDSQKILDQLWCGAVKNEKWLVPKVLIGLVCPFLVPWMLQFDWRGNVFDASQREMDQYFSSQQETQDTTSDNVESKQDQGQQEVRESTTLQGDLNNDTTNDDTPQQLSGVTERKRSYEKIPMEAELDEKEARDEDGKDKSISVSRRLAFFYTAPVTKFYCNMIFYMCFLLTFTYMVLSELPEDVYYIEWILASVVLSITSEEIRQLAIQEGRISSKVKDHLRSLWNWMDLTGIFFFWLPFVLRFVNLSFSEDVARLFYILDLFFWFMRVLNNFAVSRKLGPVVTIILNMIPILVSFSFVWIVFMAAFGIISKAVSFPQRFGDVTPYDIINVISFSYWQTYGELFLEIFQTKLQPNLTCTQHYSDNSELPPCPFAPRLSIYFLAIFMLIGNVLLMNLLIAMFSSVYEEVNSRAQTDWKNKRMSLIVEYHHRPVLPPPFVLIEHLYYLFTWNSHSIKARLANGLTVKQEDERLQELALFEEECKDVYLTTQRENNSPDISKQVRSSEKRVEAQMKVMEESMGKQLRDQTELLRNISEQLNAVLKKK